MRRVYYVNTVLAYTYQYRQQASVGALLPRPHSHARVRVLPQHQKALRVAVPRQHPRSSAPANPLGRQLGLE
jgi:hypothetical protein